MKLPAFSVFHTFYKHFQLKRGYLHVRKTNHMLLSKRKEKKRSLKSFWYLNYTCPSKSSQPTVESRGILRNPSDPGVRLSLILEGESRDRNTVS